MPDVPGWKKALQEPNAIGWIAFFFLVVAVGFGSVYFNGSGPDRTGLRHATGLHHAAK